MGIRATTNQFLKECASAGYKRICIGVAHKDVPHSLSFPFDPEGSVFAWPEKPEKNGWPAIWAICKKFDLSGCGNSHQHQIIGQPLSPGYYKLVYKKWKKL